MRQREREKGKERRIDGEGRDGGERGKEGKTMTAKQSECPFALPATTELGRGREGARERGSERVGKIEEGGGAIQWQSSWQTDSAYCILLSAVADQPATPRRPHRIPSFPFHFRAKSALGAEQTATGDGESSILSSREALPISRKIECFQFRVEK